MSNLDIQVTTKPIVEYSKLDELYTQAKANIEQYNINNDLIVDNSNIKSIKKIRSNFNNDFKYIDEKRKIVKEVILKPYNDFMVEYEKLSALYKETDRILKDKIDTYAKQEKQSIIDRHIIEVQRIINERYINIKVIEEDVIKHIKKNVLPTSLTALSKKNEIDILIDNTLSKIHFDLSNCNHKSNLFKKAFIGEYLRNGFEVNGALMYANEIQQEKDNESNIIDAQEIPTSQDNKILIDPPDNYIPEYPIEEEINARTQQVSKDVSVLFGVTTSLDKLKGLVKYMRDNNIEFEQIRKE